MWYGGVAVVAVIVVLCCDAMRSSEYSVSVCVRGTARPVLRKAGI